MLSSVIRENQKNCHSQHKGSTVTAVLILQKKHQLTSFLVSITEKSGWREVLVKYKSNTCQPTGPRVSLLSHLQKHTLCQLLYLAWPGNKNPLDRKSTVELTALFLLVPFHLLVWLLVFLFLGDSCQSHSADCWLDKTWPSLSVSHWFNRFRLETYSTDLMCW